VFRYFHIRGSVASASHTREDKVSQAALRFLGLKDGVCMLLTILVILGLGLAAGVLVGLMGIGGGILLVPVMVYVLKMEQHTAQGTSLLILLLPVGLGALREYWKQGQVDVRAGVLCAVGMLLGAFGGSLVALPMGQRHLQGVFGCFMMAAAILLWNKTRGQAAPQPSEAENPHG
jgi:uncharacterized membrane protein YfcA